MHHGNLFIPYGIADQSISIATVSVASVIDAFDAVSRITSR